MADEVVIPPIQNTPKPAPAEQPRPEWLPEKFKTAEQLAMAYAELETKLGAPAPATPAAPAVPTGPLPTPVIAKPVQPEADPLAVFEQEFATTGKLSEKSYEALAAKGYPKRVVDNYIAGSQARAAQEAASIYGMVGGQESFETMANWAASNLQEAEINALNDGLSKGGTSAQMAVRALQQAYQSQNGVTPTLLDPTGAGGAFGDSYESYEEMMKDMAKDDYKFDPAFRKKVQDKVARSTKI